MLNASPVWSAYKDQKHDLFISNTPIAGYLTGKYSPPPPRSPPLTTQHCVTIWLHIGPTTGIAGYLTAGSSSTLPPTAPPPLLEPPTEDKN